MAYKRIVDLAFLHIFPSGKIYTFQVDRKNWILCRVTCDSAVHDIFLPDCSINNPSKVQVKVLNQTRAVIVRAAICEVKIM